MSGTIKKVKKPTIKRQFRLIDFHIYDQVNETIESDSDEDNNKRRDNKEFIIQMFGINEKGESCCIFVNDYRHDYPRAFTALFAASSKVDASM